MEKMNKQLADIAQQLKLDRLKNDKRLVPFMVCLFIATALWFLNALSKDYETTIDYPVKYINAPKNQFLANTPPSKLELKVHAHGFTLLRYKLSLTFSPIILNIKNITHNLEADENGTYIIHTADILRRVSDQVSSEITVKEIHPLTIKLVLDRLKTRSLPVNAQVSYTLAPQYGLKTPLTLTPSKVEVTGPGHVVDTLTQLPTEEITLENIDRNVKKYLKIQAPPHTRIAPAKTLMTIEVEKITEKELQLPIQVRNKPEGVQIKLFPSTIKLTCLINLSNFDRVSADDFACYVDYSDIKTRLNTLPIHVESRKDSLKIARFSPQMVEYLIENTEE